MVVRRTIPSSISIAQRTWSSRKPGWRVYDRALSPEPPDLLNRRPDRVDGPGYPSLVLTPVRPSECAVPCMAGGPDLRLSQCRARPYPVVGLHDFHPLPGAGSSVAGSSAGPPAGSGALARSELL